MALLMFDTDRRVTENSEVLQPHNRGHTKTLKRGRSKQCPCCWIVGDRGKWITIPQKRNQKHLKKGVVCSFFTAGKEGFAQVRKSDGVALDLERREMLFGALHVCVKPNQFPLILVEWNNPR